MALLNTVGKTCPHVTKNHINADVFETALET